MNKAWAEKASINDLVALLDSAAEAYFNGKELLMSDVKFDALLKILRQRSPDHPFLKKVGYRPSDDPVKLPYYMGSLDKVENVAAWCRTHQGVGFVVMHKVDGVSAMLYYDKLYTRGDGDLGQDISHILRFLDYPRHPNLPAIRGELFLPHANRQDTVGLVNRNRYSGEDPRLEFVAYEILSEPMLKPSEQLQRLAEWGFRTPWVGRYGTCPLDLDAVLSAEREKGFGYPMDGLVIAADRQYTRVLSGNPEHALAYKKSVHDPAQTVVEGIEWTASRAGKMIPRVRLRPVKFGVEVVRYTTGFNARYICQNRLGPGAIVWVALKGDVIPIIVRIEAPSPDPVDLPPDTQWEGVHLVTNDDTITLVKRLTHFVKTVGIKKVNEKTVEALVKDSGIRSIDDLLDLESTVVFVKDLHKKLRDEGISLAKLLVATGIMGPGIGPKKARSLAMNEEVAAFVNRHGVKLL